MTLRLMLLRHAKSSWTDPGLDDKDRPLNARGLKAAPAMGRYMRKEGFLPDLVLCSPARRARETWKLVSEQLKTAPRLQVEDGIYDFGNGGRVLDIVRQNGGSESTVLVAGHNPSLERLALRLAGDTHGKVRKRLEQKFPTGALAVIDFDMASWNELGNKPGILVDFTRPRDIEQVKA